MARWQSGLSHFSHKEGSFGSSLVRNQPSLQVYLGCPVAPSCIKGTYSKFLRGGMVHSMVYKTIAERHAGSSPAFSSLDSFIFCYSVGHSAMSAFFKLNDWCMSSEWHKNTFLLANIWKMTKKCISLHCNSETTASQAVFLKIKIVYVHTELT